MFFTGRFEVTVNDKGEFFIPEYYAEEMEVGTKYDVFCGLTGYEKDMLFFVFSQPEKYYDCGKKLCSGRVTEDKKLQVPEEFLEKMKGEAHLIGNFCALELTKVPIELLVDEDDIKGLKINIE